jgi:hypothetical protein
MNNQLNLIWVYKKIEKTEDMDPRLREDEGRIRMTRRGIKFVESRVSFVDLCFEPLKEEFYEINLLLMVFYTTL